MHELLQNWMVAKGLPAEATFYLVNLLSFLVVLLLSAITAYISRKYLPRIVNKIVVRTKNHWDDIFLNQNIINRLGRLASVWVIYVLIPQALAELPQVVFFIMNITHIYIIVLLILILDALVDALVDIYNTFKISKEIPITSLVQIIKIALYFFGGVFIVSILLNKTPLYLLSGLGALSAILMLIFKDAILGFVAGIQLTANKMIAHGDWISMPNYGADGDVLEVSLATVKVQNFDKTITTIPTYALISESFKNWRGMEKSAGRRIKRAIAIDMSVIKFCDKEMIERFSKIQYIAAYVEKKKAELSEFNKNTKVDDSSLANGRRMTNIGTFRAYVVAYLHNHPMVNTDMTFLVRQLKPTAEGLPIEIYVFSADKAWANYEAIQADIFDHILAVIPEFDLRVFQNPTGGDFSALKLSSKK